MPSTYAHYSFANAVKERLSPQLQKIIDDNLTLYLIGCHGPDILFYYKAIKRNSINDIGYGMHGEPAAPFFEKAKKIIDQSDDKEASLGYILGFITHFALDSECHGYVEEKRAKDGVSHTKIEVEFDRALLISDGKNPVKAQLAEHIKADNDCAHVIAPFFGLDEKTVKRSLKDMKRICNLFVAPSSFKRAVLYKALSLTGVDELKDQIVGYSPDPKCADSTLILTEKFDNALSVAVSLIDNFISSDGALPERFDRNYE